MKILLSCIDINGIGGSEMYHYELSRGLKKLGHDVSLLVYRDTHTESIIKQKLEILSIIRCLIMFELGQTPSFDRIM